MTPATIDWTRWRDQQVRDLAWCCLTPPLMQSLPGTDARPWQVSETAALLPWLDQLAAAPEPLRRHLSGLNSSRLGVYFESLWVFFWQQQPTVELLAYNRQVNRHGKTLGAFDFLLQDKQGGRPQYYHLEAAVKFYLGSSFTSTHWRDWVGPNCQDTLERKLTHLRDHQLPLSQTPALSEWQPVSGIPLTAFARRTLLAGRFYAPWQAPQLLPQGGNPCLSTSMWCHRHQLGKVSESLFRGRQAKILRRQQWLAPALDEGDLNDITTIVQQIPLSMERALQLAIFPPASAASQRSAVEACRLFVMPDHWPNTATPERST